MVVRSHDLLTWQSMSRVVNNIQPNRNALSRLFFPPSTIDTLDTETVELSTLEGDAEIAPFVKANAASILVGGDRETFATLSTPNIRISRTLEPSALMFNRAPGTPIFSSRQQKLSVTQRKIATALRRLNDRIVNTIEYMTAQLLRGSITYAVEDGANFTVTLPRSAENDTTLVTATWWDADQTTNTARPIEQFDYAKLRLSTIGLPVNGVLFGEEAYLWFTRLLEPGNSAFKLFDRNINIIGGGLDLTRQFSEVGLIPVGSMMGIPIWRYPRSVKVAGSDFPLIRPKYIEFFSNSPAAEHTLYYGAIPDMEALQSRLHIGTRYSKSWTTKDPSGLKMLVHSRPLPWFKRADSILSMKVISG